MGMFTNYQTELLNVYQPNNLMNTFHTPVSNSKLNPVDASKPFEEYDAKGKHVGYFWRQGETLNLEFSLEGEITVECDAFVRSTKGEEPGTLMAQRPGQKYYNIADMRSWYCYFDRNRTVWVEEEEFTYPETGSELQHVYMPAAEYLKDKSVVVTLFNFRMEPIHTWFPQVKDSRIVCTVDKELSSTITRGVYYCSVVVENTQVRFTLFDTHDCILVVK